MERPQGKNRRSWGLTITMVTNHWTEMGWYSKYRYLNDPLNFWPSIYGLSFRSHFLGVFAGLDAWKKWTKSILPNGSEKWWWILWDRIREKIHQQKQVAVNKSIEIPQLCLRTCFKASLSTMRVEFEMASAEFVFLPVPVVNKWDIEKPSSATWRRNSAWLQVPGSEMFMALLHFFLGGFSSPSI